MWTRREWTKLSVSGALVSCRQPENYRTLGQYASGILPANGNLLSRSIVLDLHCDTPIRLVEENLDLGKLHTSGELDIPRMRQGGITGVFFSIYTGATDKTALEAVKKALEIIDAVIEETHRHPKELTLATSPEDIIGAKQAGKIAILMGVEGGHMIDSSLSVLRTFYRLGVRYLTLTHSASTGWADTSGGSEGLTDFGKDVVREMNRLGMMVDISHVSDKTFFDVIQTSRAPIVASHSSCRALASHPRNMTDEMLRALATNDGVIHINYYNAFLDDTYINRERTNRTGRVPLSRLLDHFEHAVKVAGVDHVGMGSDFDGVQGQLPEKMEDISKIPNLVAGLSERGFSDTDIEKILGENSLRVMRRVQNLATDCTPDNQRFRATKATL